MKKLITNIGLSIFSIALCITAGELGLRLTGLQTVKPNPPKIYQKSSDPRISYELIPNVNRMAYRNRVKTDERGFRSPSVDPDKPLIAMLGDSITFGYGVKNNETLAARLHAEQPNFQVLNAGVPGYQLLQETAVYETKIRELTPEILVLVFYFNDFSSATAWLDDNGVIREEGWVPAEEECYPIEQGLMGYIPYRCWLDLNSAMYKAMKKLVNIRYMNENLAEDRKQSQENPQTDSVTVEELQVYTDQLDDLVALVDDEVDKLFVIWPDRELHIASRKKLNSIAKSRGFVVVDLYDIFSNEAETLGWDSVHPSADTINDAAKYIWKSMLRNGFFDRRN